MHCCRCICVDSSSGWFSSLWEISRDFFFSFYFIFRSILLSMCNVHTFMVSLVILFHLILVIFSPSLCFILHISVSASVSVVSFRRRFRSVFSKTTENLLCQRKKNRPKKMRKKEKKKERRNRNSAGFIKRMYTECVWSENVLIRPVASWYTKTIYSHVIDACEPWTLRSVSF